MPNLFQTDDACKAVTERRKRGHSKQRNCKRDGINLRNQMIQEGMKNFLILIDLLTGFLLEEIMHDTMKRFILFFTRRTFMDFTQILIA